MPIQYCAECGGEIRHGPGAGGTGPRHPRPAGKGLLYQNPKIRVAPPPIHEDKLILIRRGIEPGYGLWGYPGGFLELGETVEEGAIRETLEETGFEIEIGRSVGIYSRIQAGVVVLVFEARVVGGAARISEE